MLPQRSQGLFAVERTQHLCQDAFSAKAIIQIHTDSATLAEAMIGLNTLIQLFCSLFQNEDLQDCADLQGLNSCSDGPLCRRGEESAQSLLNGRAVRQAHLDGEAQRLQWHA